MPWCLFFSNGGFPPFEPLEHAFLLSTFLYGVGGGLGATQSGQITKPMGEFDR